VLAHERAHQRGHHHLLILLAAALHRALPGPRLLGYADGEVRRLVELIADDAAARDHGRLTVAAALAVIGAGHLPGGALGAAEGPGALARITRLAGPDARLSRLRTVLSVLVVTFAIVLPLTIALSPLGMLMRHCPPSRETEGQLPESRSVISRLR
jgi:hypothetical protein